MKRKKCMSDEKQNKPVIHPDLEFALRQERADEAWARFVMNEQPSALADYLLLGGEVTDQVRAALVEVLVSNTKGRKGGSKPFRDWQTYLSVEEMLLDDDIGRKIAAVTGDTHNSSIPRKAISRTQALAAFAEVTGQELRSVEIQYQRGAKVEKQFKPSTK